LNQGKISIGNDNIIGVVSATPGFIGDSAYFRWHGAFKRDEFGRILTEEKTFYTWDDEETLREAYKEEDKYYDRFTDEEISLPDEHESYTITQRVRNPDWDENQEYMRRQDRPEWDPVGLLGKLWVRTAETITANRIDVDENGKAINGSTYIVLETKNNLVRILCK